MTTVQDAVVHLACSRAILYGRVVCSRPAFSTAIHVNMVTGLANYSC